MKLYCEIHYTMHVNLYLPTCVYVYVYTGMDIYSLGKFRCVSKKPSLANNSYLRCISLCRFLGNHAAFGQVELRWRFIGSKREILSHLIFPSTHFQEQLTKLFFLYLLRLYQSRYMNIIIIIFVNSDVRCSEEAE